MRRKLPRSQSCDDCGLRISAQTRPRMRPCIECTHAARHHGGTLLKFRCVVVCACAGVRVCAFMCAGVHVCTCRVWKE